MTQALDPEDGEAQLGGRTVGSTPEPPSVTLIEGRPGSGKTTLVWKLVYGWCSGTGRWAKRYNLVFTLILRTLQEVPEYLNLSLPELLCASCLQNNPGLTPKMVADAMLYEPDRVLVVLDGLDEYHWTIPAVNALMESSTPTPTATARKKNGGKMENNAANSRSSDGGGGSDNKSNGNGATATITTFHLMLLSRPTVEEGKLQIIRARASQHFELAGLRSHHMQQFITAYFQRSGPKGAKGLESHVIELMATIATDPDLRTMCQIPINLALVCAAAVEFPEALRPPDGRGVSLTHLYTTITRLVCEKATASIPDLYGQ